MEADTSMEPFIITKLDGSSHQNHANSRVTAILSTKNS